MYQVSANLTIPKLFQMPFLQQTKEENDPNNNFQLLQPLQPLNKTLSPYPKEPSMPEATSIDCTSRLKPPDKKRDFFDGQGQILLKQMKSDDEKKNICKLSPSPFAIGSSHETKHDVLKTEIIAPVREEAVANKLPTSAELEDKEIKAEEATEKQKPFRCQDCGKCFSQLRNYKYHR